MDKKLRILMQNENLTASKLADILDIKPAAVSHILSGRNKPSFELICKLVNRFPRINPYWLLGDAEEMLNANITNVFAFILSFNLPKTMFATQNTDNNITGI
jgi:transcriptional regulator with XRE-family HTH domain